jgi:phycocyanobilin:ferredoxin oxidoreductase
MNAIEIVDNIARKLIQVLELQPEVEFIPTKDYGWKNYRWCSTNFRLAHIEIFKQEKFCVIHCCVFPHTTDPAPVYGFDVIAGENKITGVFLDLSPTILPPTPFTNLDTEVERNRPEWGDIFSPFWLACRPNLAEMELIGNEAVVVLKDYLQTLGKVDNQKIIVEKQNYYCKQQQKNPHTRKALINLLGEEGADEFMTQVLFPVI